MPKLTRSLTRLTELTLREECRRLISWETLIVCTCVPDIQPVFVWSSAVILRSEDTSRISSTSRPFNSKLCYSVTSHKPAIKHKEIRQVHKKFTFSSRLFIINLFVNVLLWIVFVIRFVKIKVTCHMSNILYIKY